MKTVQSGKSLSLPRTIMCNDCDCIIEYDKEDIIEGHIVTINNQYFYVIHFIYCPDCKITINVPSIYI